MRCPARAGNAGLAHDECQSRILPFMRIEIICTGDEVLTGKIVNTNFSTLSQKLEDVGLSVVWGTTVGDDRDTLLRAFQHAGGRADAVIVNGGLGPTVDDLLSQGSRRPGPPASPSKFERGMAGENGKAASPAAAASCRRTGRKQAMLPAGAEMLDNPVGTACGFALDIGRARFFFTPGVPRELWRMLDDQVIPRLLARSGAPTVIRQKRFHAYGHGEYNDDTKLAGVEDLVPGGGVKLGFRAHYPQLETKLTVRGTDLDDIRRKLAPVQAEVRKRLGNFILGEDDQTLEGVILAALTERRATLAMVETFTGGAMSARLASLPGAEKAFRRGIVARDFAQVYEAVGLPAAEMSQQAAAAVATARERCGATHALAVLIEA